MQSLWNKSHEPSISNQAEKLPMCSNSFTRNFNQHLHVKYKRTSLSSTSIPFRKFSMFKQLLLRGGIKPAHLEWVPLWHFVGAADDHHELTFSTQFIDIQSYLVCTAVFQLSSLSRTIPLQSTHISKLQQNAINLNSPIAMPWWFPDCSRLFCKTSRFRTELVAALSQSLNFNWSFVLEAGKFPVADDKPYHAGRHAPAISSPMHAMGH